MDEYDGRKRQSARTRGEHGLIARRIYDARATTTISRGIGTGDRQTRIAEHKNVRDGLMSSEAQVY